jgi:hypothetical protein
MSCSSRWGYITCKITINLFSSSCFLGLGGSNTVIFALFFSGLESTVSVLAGSIDELQSDIFECSSASLWEKTLSQNNNSLLGSDAASLNQDEIVVNNTVMGETAQRSNGLLSQIGSGGSIVLSSFIFNTSSDSVDLLVDFGSVVITVLTSSGDAVPDSGWMPASDATNSSKTSVGLSWQSLGSPSSGGTFESFTLGDTDDIDHFVSFEDVRNFDFLFEVGVSPIDLLSNGASIDLDFQNVSLLLSEVEEVELGVDDDSNNLAIFLQSVELGSDILFILKLLSILGESLLLGVHPILVQSSSELGRKMLGPDCGQCSQTSGSLNIPNDADNDDWGSFKNGCSFNDFFLVQFRSDFVNFSEDVGHTSFEDWEGSQVDRLAFVVLGEGTNSTSMMLGPLSWKES